MVNYNINFIGQDNCVNKNNIVKNECFRIFNKYNVSNIDLIKFVTTLYDDGWRVIEKTINPDYQVFKCYSHKYEANLFINISTLKSYIDTNIVEYEEAMNILNKMARNAKIVNNKIIDIKNFQPMKNNSKYNLNVSNLKNFQLKGVRNLKVYPNTKKIFIKRTKIVLATIAVSATAIFTGIAAYNLYQQDNAQATQKSNHNSYSQGYHESPIPDVSQEVYDRSIEIAKESSHMR